MPECQNCGATVSKHYVRVQEPPELEHPRVCPNCPDLQRDGNGHVVEKRTKTYHR